MCEPVQIKWRVFFVYISRRRGCQYSQYADDLTFSTNLPWFPYQIAQDKSKNKYLALMQGFYAHVFQFLGINTNPKNNNTDWLAGSKLESIIASSGFVLNKQKTRMLLK